MDNSLPQSDGFSVIAMLAWLVVPSTAWRLEHGDGLVQAVCVHDWSWAANAAEKAVAMAKAWSD